ncbi:MAG: CDP-diacylglycerol--glycerol-3-phosphate 3-phosphatidyltransferase [Verrucomicrobia bacterium]|nr:CDP-diacylglycerol--glycerol-3-phosphate 3-phosphatidyltransferase [Verrucomicrobiota bacterium]
MNLPNKITLFRVPLTAVFFVFFFDQPLPYLFPELRPTPYHHTIAFFCFLLACASDWSDGYLARRRNQITNFGKFWDPVADKILVTAAWVTLVANKAMPAWIVLVLLSRDFAVSGLRMMAAQQGITLAAETGGKIKTFTQLLTIGVLCAHCALTSDWGWKLDKPGSAWFEEWLLYPACVLTSLVSAWIYFHGNRSLLRA